MNNKLVDRVESQKYTTYTEVFRDTIVDIAKVNKNIIAITAAMPLGTGLDKFARHYPDRFFDVGIAEQHALTFSAGLSKKGFVPFVAIYSTFLQRGYDQIFHDICLQDLPLVLCIDRAGLVGGDGATHHGVFDIAYLRHLPNLVIMAPKDADEFISMLYTAIEIKHPVAIRYPKAKVSIPKSRKYDILPVGKSEVLKEGSDLCILAYGSMVDEAHQAALYLKEENISAEVINVRFIKPLDKDILKSMEKCRSNVVTVEEGCSAGGLGSLILESLEAERIKGVNLRILALTDKFIEHAPRELLLERYGLSAQKITDFIKKEFFK